MSGLDNLKKNQNTACRILGNDLESGRISNAYLFTGPKSARKKEAAVLFAQSLVCPNTKNGWACENCDVCKRIKKEEYADVMILDGSKESIRKKQIEALQAYFSKTALEKYGKKAYVINAVDNMTSSSMNSILKFLEEPDQEITAILCTDNPDRLLATIRSRCKTVPFKSAGLSEREEEAVEAGIAPLDAHILAANTDDVKMMKKTAENESYQNAREFWKEYIHQCHVSVTGGTFYLVNEAFGGKDKEKRKNSLPWFLKCGLVFVSDLSSGRRGMDTAWDECLDEFEEVPVSGEAMMKILLECLDALLINANPALVIDKLGYRMSKEERHG